MMRDILMRQILNCPYDCVSVSGMSGMLYIVSAIKFHQFSASAGEIKKIISLHQGKIELPTSSYRS